MLISKFARRSRSITQTLIRQYFTKNKTGVLDNYIRTAPSPQTALDIFQGEWTSRLPEPLAEYQAGGLGLFDDGRIKWFEEEIGGLAGKSVLELGPLEGGHTYMLEKFGAAQIISVEANTRAFLKCLIAKELLNLQRVHFVCGDCVEYLRQAGPNFEVCVASGVLYHMMNPVELIALLAKRCTHSLFMWTHYYDPAVISAGGHSSRFKHSKKAAYDGFEHTLFQQEYQKALNWVGFCGGSAATSCWLDRNDLLGCLEHFGFGKIRLNFDDPSHPNGPALALVAERQ